MNDIWHVLYTAHTKIIPSLPVSYSDNLPYTGTHTHTQTEQWNTHASLIWLKLRVSFHYESEWRVILNSSLFGGLSADRTREKKELGENTLG